MEQQQFGQSQLQQIQQKDLNQMNQQEQEQFLSLYKQMMRENQMNQ